MQGYAVSLYDVAWSPDGPSSSPYLPAPQAGLPVVSVPQTASRQGGGSQLASAGSDLLLTIWDGAGRTPPRVLRGHRWNVYGVAWSPDGRFLASSGWDNAVRVWDTSTGAEVHILRDPDGVDTSFYGVAWSPDGKLLASGSYQQGGQGWEVSTGTRRWVGSAQSTRIRRVAWSPDGPSSSPYYLSPRQGGGSLLASGGEDGSVCLWQA